MFYTQFVRVGDHVRVGYFIWPLSKPYWIGRKVRWYLTAK
jgi:hypothetical protein